MSDLDDLTMNELRAYAVDLGVPSISRLRKDELVAAIEESEGGDGLASQVAAPAPAHDAPGSRYQMRTNEDGNYFVLDTTNGALVDGSWAGGDGTLGNSVSGRELAVARTEKFNRVNAARA